MSEDRVDVSEWQVPPPPDGIVDRVMGALGEDTRVAHVPAQPVDVSPPRRGIAMAVVAAAVLGAAAAAAAVVVVYEGRERDAGDRAAARPTAAAPSPSKKAAAPPPKAPPRDLPTAPRRLPSQAAREELLEDIVRARVEREHAGAATSGGGGAGFGGAMSGGAMSDPAAMDPEEIRNSVRDVLPLLADCYTQAPAEVQEAGGTLVAELTVTGEPDVGALIQDVAVIEGDDVLIANADFRECITQNLLSVELPPLDAGGELTIRYPFAFALSEDDTEADRLSEQATDEARAKRYREALALVKQALALDPEHEQALMTGAVCACNLKLRDLAVAYIAKLEGGRAGMARQICLRNGVKL
jgi:hypothetical protein